MTGTSNRRPGDAGPPPGSPSQSPSTPVRERPGGPTQDQLLDEALEETFPASDPISVYRFG